MMMSTWYCVEITEACVLGGTYHRLCRQFQQAFIACEAPADMALFAQTFPVDDTRYVYFSPGCVGQIRSLIESYEGRPCKPPSREEVTLVFGVPDAKERLLPELAPASHKRGLAQPSLLLPPSRTKAGLPSYATP